MDGEHRPPRWFYVFSLILLGALVLVVDQVLTWLLGR